MTSLRIAGGAVASVLAALRRPQRSFGPLRALALPIVWAPEMAGSGL